MKKPIKKISPKKVSKKIIPKKELVEKKEYKLFLKLNDQIFEIETNDLFASIMDHKPENLKTRLTIEVEKNGKRFTRIIFAPRGRMLFRNKTWLEVLIKQIKMIIG